MMSPLELAERLERATARLEAGIAEPTEAVMMLVEAQAREVVGTYAYDWEELAPATKADRVRQGYPEDEPLLRTGALAASIKHKIEVSASFYGAQGLIYSEDKIALYQELGTKRIPARSFLFGSLVRAIPEIERIFGGYIVRILTEV